MLIESNCFEVFWVQGKELINLYTFKTLKYTK